MARRLMIKRLELRRCVVLLLAAALLASACGGSSGGADVASVADDATPDASAGSDATDAEAAQTADDSVAAAGGGVEAGGTAMAASSPLGQFFDGGFDEAVAEYRVRVGESIALCMAEQGFEFVLGGTGQTNEVQERQNELTLREWTAEYGFGISTSFDSIASDRTGDPNTALFFSMSPSEREIWSETLSGGDIGAAVGGDFTSRPLEDQGCIGQALIETGGQEAIEGLETFGNAYEEGEEALFDTREMVAAVDAWTLCMGESGFPTYGDLDDPEDDFSDRLAVVTAPMSAAFENLSEEEGQALISGESLGVDELPDLDVQALRDLQDEERRVALVDLDCYEAQVLDIFEPLRDDFENGLLTEYSTELGALKNIGS